MIFRSRSLPFICSPARSLFSFPFSRQPRFLSSRVLFSSRAVTRKVRESHTQRENERKTICCAKLQRAKPKKGRKKATTENENGIKIFMSLCVTGLSFEVGFFRSFSSFSIHSFFLFHTIIFLSFSSTVFFLCFFLVIVSLLASGVCVCVCFYSKSEESKRDVK